MGFLMRLRRDARGSAAVMMAVMVVPLLLFVGSAVDVARVYTVKSRLQQACDAGVLAGKASMTDLTNNGVLDATATKQAKAFFANNFWYVQDDTDLSKPGSAGWMQTVPAADTANKGKYLPVFKPSKTSELRVAGVATIQVPMALMRVFGFKPIVLQTTCEARYETDADIMFVLDQTGSMACPTGYDNDTTCKYYVGNTSNRVTNADGTYSIKESTDLDGSRISGLRTEVLNFYDTVTKQADRSTNFRFGFVPYTATANVGYLLPTAYLKTSADYDTRIMIDTASGSAVAKSGTCTPGRSPDPGSYYKDSSGNKYATITSGTTGNCTTQKVVPTNNWKYLRMSWPTSAFLTGVPVDNPSQIDSTTSKWTGCIEERVDTGSNSQTSFSTSNPWKDLDPDTAPASAADGWAPWWPEVTFVRTATPETSNATRTFYDRPDGGSLTAEKGKVYNEVDCPLAAMRLITTKLPGNSDQSIRDNARTTLRASIDNYLKASNGFTPYGTTYHDVGMMWGLRLISPTGMFAADTAAWPARNPPNRFIIFLTDGDIETDPASDGMVYSEYGMETFAKRVGNGATGTSLDDYHNKRFLAECQMAKNRGIKVFVIGYAQALTNELTTCASPGQAYPASDQAGLKKAFDAIAGQVAMLRLSK